MVVQVAVQDIHYHLEHYDKFGFGGSIYKTWEILETSGVTLRYQIHISEPDMGRMDALCAKWRGEAKKAVRCW